MALGSVDNLYYNALVGYNSLPFSFTLLLDEVICPVLLATALNSTTTGTTPNFVNTLNIRNTIASSGALTIDNQKLTFFVTDGDNGIIRYTNKVFGEFNLTVGVEGLDAEFTFDSGEREVLTSTALTNAQTAFTTLKSNLETALNALKVSLAREVNLDDYYQFAKPAGATIVYGSDYTFATSTVSKADFGFSVGLAFTTSFTGACSVAALWNALRALRRLLRFSPLCTFSTAFAAAASSCEAFTNCSIVGQYLDGYLNIYGRFITPSV